MARLETDAAMNLDDDDDESVDVKWRPSPGALRNVIATVLVGALIAGAVYFFDRPGEANSQTVTLTASAQGSEPKIGKPAPDFVLTMTDGTKQQLSSFKGKPVWVSFWASWCPPCRAENPDIQDVYNEHHESDGLVFLAPAIGEAADSVISYMERADLHYPVGVDSDTQIAANYRVLGIPTHIFVDREGIIRDMRIGAMSKKTMEKMVAEIAAAPTTTP
jgi:cytochrome c biogenesis protein CcmG/thiol:disulfide interchange protein DsbE